MLLGWIDFSKDDRDKALDILNLLREPKAVDELGIGGIRDAFADRFFPGTSTIQTRAKYFLVVPYILQDTEQKIKNGLLRPYNAAMKEIDQREMQCAKELLQGEGDKNGIIGSRNLKNEKWVARTPMSIYWHGLCTYGIFRQGKLHVNEYIQAVFELSKRGKETKLGNYKDGASENEHDDIHADGDIGNVFWRILPHSNWEKNLSIELSSEEALFLKTCIVQTQSDSLFAFLLKNNIDTSQYNNNFNALTKDVKGQVSETMGNVMEMACLFNHLIYPARVRYNCLLSKETNQTAAEQWQKIRLSLSQNVSALNLQKLFSTLHINDPKLKIFLNKLQEAFLSNDIEAADQCIQQREESIKGKARAKLTHPDTAFADIWVGGEYLDYRLATANQLIQDILKGEKITHV